VLVSGAIDLVYHIEHTDGIEISFVGSLAAGEPFGVSAFVEPYRLMATGMAHGAVQAIAIDAAELRALCDSNCHLGYTLMRQIARAGRAAGVRLCRAGRVPIRGLLRPGSANATRSSAVAPPTSRDESS
jgi:CRP-like cAMP-binding protein